MDSQGHIRLIDYDGWFLPALSGRPPGELGHPNYQHPERLSNGYYAANADAFSALVIYLSLLALRADPGLWSLYNSGENLLLKADDFTQPGQTPVWRSLQGSSDPDVRRLAADLAGFCQGSVANVPDLEAVLQGLPGGTLVAPHPGPAVLSPQRSYTVVPPATITCPRCKQPNDAADIYCKDCTYQLCGNRGCQHCQGTAPARAVYCPECGGRL